MTDASNRQRLAYGVDKIRGMRPHRPKNPIVNFFTMIAASLFGGLMLTCIISIAIWPGEAKLLAPILCTDARPDAVVVYDTYNPSPGETVTDFSLYCMGPNGDVTNHGWWIVFMWLTLLHTSLFLAMFAINRLTGPSQRKPSSGHGLITQA